MNIQKTQSVNFTGFIEKMHRVNRQDNAQKYLTSEEIKAIRAGKVDMSSSYAKIINGEIFWLGGSINAESGDRQRTRKLLLHKEQIQKLFGKTQEKGLTLIPLKLYLTRGKAKIELGLGRGMKKYEKREVLKKKDTKRDIEISLKNSK